MRNVMDAKESGAEAMVFLRPLCALNLRSRAEAQGMEPFMLSNLVRLALNENSLMEERGKVKQLWELFMSSGSLLFQPALTCGVLKAL